MQILPKNEKCGERESAWMVFSLSRSTDWLHLRGIHLSFFIWAVLNLIVTKTAIPFGCRLFAFVVYALDSTIRSNMVKSFSDKRCFLSCYLVFNAITPSKRKLTMNNNSVWEMRKLEQDEVNWDISCRELRKQGKVLRFSSRSLLRQKAITLSVMWPRNPRPGVICVNVECKLEKAELFL